MMVIMGGNSLDSASICPVDGSAPLSEFIFCDLWSNSAPAPDVTLELAK